MDNQKTDFIIQAALLDKYIHLSNPMSDPVGVAVVIKKLRHSPDLHRYFFGQNPSAGWANGLYQNGFFEEPPDVILVENGYGTPFWMLSAYLLNVSDSAPEIVVKVTSELETNNPIIQEHLVKALCKIPASEAVKFARKVKGWLRNEYSSFWGVTEGVTDLISYLLQNNFVEESLELIDEILTPIPSPVRKSGDYIYGGEAKPRQELDYLRQNFWHERIPEFEKKTFPGIIKILEGKLIDAIRVEMEAQGKKIDLTSWESFGWRLSIGDSEQNLSDSFKDHLLIALRDSLDSRSKNQPEQIRPILKKYLSDNIILLRRIALFICAMHPITYSDFAKKELLKKDVHNDVRIHTEYFQLLNKSYPQLPDKEKDVIVQIILDGPDEEITKTKREVAKNSNISLEEYLTRRKNFWIRDRLLIIENFISSKNRNLLNNLLESYGRPEHPDFLVWSSGGFMVRDVSPLSINDFSQMSPNEVLNFVKNWESDPNQEFGPERISITGLGNALAELVLNNPLKYEIIINSMHELHPMIPASIFNRALKFLEENKSTPWLSFIKLAYKSSEKNYKQSTLDDSLEARLGAIRFVRQYLSQKIKEDTIIPESELAEVKKTINVFLEDSHPNIEQDRPPKGYMGYKDPITVSLNSVRPIAFVCFMEVLQYNWLKSKTNSINGDLLTDDTRKILNKNLDKIQEPSLAVHSIYGQYFWLLANISMDWVKKNRKRIFPIEGQDNEDYFSAAWDSYLVFNKPSLSTISMLRNEYVKGIERLERKDLETTSFRFQDHLFSHLFLGYIWNPYDLTNNECLLGIFFNRCNASTRGAAVNIMCRMLKNSDKKELAEKWPFIKNLWQWRATELSLTQYPEEFRPEMEEFSALPMIAPNTESLRDMWSLLKLFLSFVDEYRVWKNLEEFLASRVVDESEDVANYYFEMHKNLEKPKFGYFPNYDEEADKILNTAIKNIQSRRTVLATIDFIYRNGNKRYRNLYEEYT